MGDGATSQQKCVHQPPIIFKDELLTLEEIVRKYELPRAIHCDMGLFRENLLDLSKPILAFSKRSAQKVSARCLQWDCGRRALKVTGSDLLIPEDYAGWFAILGSTDGASDLKSVTPYRTLTCLNKSNTNSFLIGGISPISCYLVMNCYNSVKHIAHHVLPGDILRKAGNKVFQGGSFALVNLNAETEGHNGTLYSSGTTTDNKKLQTYYMYHDEKDRSILINSKQRGLFYVTSQDGEVSDEETVALKLKDIIKKNKFPLIVKLLHGLVPSVSCGFTGIFLLTNVDKEDTVVAATLMKNHVTSLEFPLDSDMLFQVAENTPELTSSEVWTNAVAHCRSRALIYNKAIKVIADYDTDDVDENGSDLRYIPHEEPRRENVDKTPKSSKPEDHPKEDIVKMRPGSRSSSGRSRQSIVSDITKRVGVYALDFSINTRHFSARQNRRAEAFRTGVFGHPHVDSGVSMGSGPVSSTSSIMDRPSSAASSIGDLPSSAISGHGDQHGNDPFSTFNNHLLEDTDSISSDGISGITIKCIPGRPTSLNLNVQVPRDTVPDLSNDDAIASTGFDPNISPENPPNGGSRTGYSLNQLHQDSSLNVYNVFQHRDQFVTIGPRSFHETTFDDCPSNTDANPTFMPFFLFNGSLSSRDDYITPASDFGDGENPYNDPDNDYVWPNENENTSNSQPGSKKQIFNSKNIQEQPSQYPLLNDKPLNPLTPKLDIRPTLPERKARTQIPLTSAFSPPWNIALRNCASPKPSGCYNRDLLIEELKKEIAIDSAMELAFRGLTLAELTTLLYEDEVMDAHLTALLPKLGQLDLKKVALCLRSMRPKIVILTLE